MFVYRWGLRINLVEASRKSDGGDRWCFADGDPVNELGYVAAAFPASGRGRCSGAGFLVGEELVELSGYGVSRPARHSVELRSLLANLSVCRGSCILYNDQRERVR